MDIRLFTILGAALLCHVMQAARTRRCYVCRSRGSLGDCRDPFWWNSTTVAKNHAIELSPCASGWCGKVIEGKDGDHLQATERICLQRPPSDGEERCSDTLFANKRSPIFMCFCKGDLCNSAPKTSTTALSLLTSLLVLVAPRLL